MPTLKDISNERFRRIEHDAKRLNRNPDFVGPVRSIVKEIEQEKQYR